MINADIAEDPEHALREQRIDAAPRSGDERPKRISRRTSRRHIWLVC
jgi:hypothetical protein